MDDLIIALSNVSGQFLPILGAIALIFLCICLNKVSKLLDKLTETVGSLDPTIKLVDQSIEKAQAPLDTAVKLSHTIDDVHTKTVDSISKAAVLANEKLNELRTTLDEKLEASDSDPITYDMYPKAPSNIINEEE